MSQGTTGNKIHTSFQNLLDIFFCNITGTLSLCSSMDQLYCLFHHFRSHIVQHNDICTCFYCFFYLIQSLYFDFDLTDKRCIGFCHLDGFGNTSSCSDVVILQKHTIRKVITVVASPTYTHCIFLKNTTVGCGLSGIQKSDFAAFQKCCHLAGISGNSTHSLKIIQCHSFSGKKDPDITCYNCQKLSTGNFISIFTFQIYFCFFIQKLEYSCVNIHSCNNAVFFGDQIYSSFGCTWHHCIGGYVLTCDVLCQCHTDQLICL